MAEPDVHEKQGFVPQQVVDVDADPGLCSLHGEKGEVSLALGLQEQPRMPHHAPIGTGIEEMRDALHRAGLFGLDFGDLPGPQLQRGPAFVAPLPLTQPSPRAMWGVGAEAGLRDLKAAMLLAGLAAER